MIINQILSYPEFFLAFNALLILILASFFKFNRVFLSFLFSLNFLLVILLFIIYLFKPSVNIHFHIIKILILVLSCVLSLFWYKIFPLSSFLAESYFFFSLSSSFLSLLVTTTNLLYALLLIEGVSLSFYILISLYSRGSFSLLAALKYYFIGTFISIIFYIGLYFIYKSTNSLDLSTLILSKNFTDYYSFFILGITFFVVSIAFKVGAAPLHFWVPEVYQGSPLYVLPLIAVLSKLGVISFLYYNFVSVSSVILGLLSSLKVLFYALAILSMFIGNFLALRQTNLIRLLAYSSIVNVGYLLTFFTLNYYFQSVPYYLAYLVFYSISLFGIFLILSFIFLLTNCQKNQFQLSDLSFYISNCNPFLKMAFFLFVLNLSGLPPTLGFIFKVFIVFQIIKSSKFTLALLFLISTGLSYYYYWRIIKVAISAETKKKIASYYQFSEIFMTLLLIVLGIYLFSSLFVLNSIPFFK